MAKAKAISSTAAALAHPSLTLALPAILAALFGLVGCSDLPLFDYTTDAGVKYEIGALGYRQDGVAVPEAYHYAAPPTWPAPLEHAPLLLLMHLPIFILLVLVLAYLGFILLRPTAGNSSAEPLKRVRRVPDVARAAQLAVWAAALAVVVADALVWGVADAWGDRLTGAPLGFCIVILGPILLVLWLLNQLYAWHAYRQHRRQKSGSSGRSGGRGARHYPRK